MTDPIAYILFRKGVVVVYPSFLNGGRLTSQWISNDNYTTISVILPKTLSMDMWAEVSPEEIQAQISLGVLDTGFPSAVVVASVMEEGKFDPIKGFIRYGTNR